MNLAAKIAAVAAIALVPSFADVMPIAGSTSGTFSGISGGTLSSGNTLWTYDTGDGVSTLKFTGNTFDSTQNCLSFGPGCSTPANVDLGTLTDTNDRHDNTNQTLSGTLNLTISFTTPAGGTATFSGAIGINEVCGLLGDSDCVTGLNNFDPPPSFTFTAGSDQYTVTLDGFYQGIFGPQSEFDTANNHTGSADLWATVTSKPTTNGQVPEPTSVLLLGTIGGAVVLASRKRRKA